MRTIREILNKKGVKKAEIIGGTILVEDYETALKISSLPTVYRIVIKNKND